MFKLQKTSALKRENPALKKLILLTFFYVCGSFLTSWIQILIGNPDPDTDLGTRIRIHSTVMKPAKSLFIVCLRKKRLI